MSTRPYFELEILLGDFQSFDHRVSISMDVPTEWDLHAGETICWSCAQFTGTASILKVTVVDGKTIAVIRKIS